MLVIPGTVTGVHAKTESAEYKAAKAAVAAAQAEVDKAQAVIDKGAIGFYEANGDSVAVSIINDGNNIFFFLTIYVHRHLFNGDCAILGKNLPLILGKSAHDSERKCQNGHFWENFHIKPIDLGQI